MMDDERSLMATRMGIDQWSRQAPDESDYNLKAPNEPFHTPKPATPQPDSDRLAQRRKGLQLVH
ncbi:hypothetical protein SAMN06265222_107306 [Neorhodopirellula lusitana]|uniref:Uncharacterized protein n=2 Tax=Neorhodopirellula lusitana TaxID=445327 RepID=A0ABY1Q9C6_9BACT|nr:hypothetical protein SAMN06265222_107306 [Neorhodopirellula lusitana]